MKKTLILLTLSLCAVSCYASSEEGFFESSNTLAAREASPDFLLPAYVHSSSPYKQRLIRKLKKDLRNKNSYRNHMRKRVFALQKAYKFANKKYQKALRRKRGFETCLKDRSKFIWRCRRRKDFYRANRYRCNNMKTCGYRKNIERHFNDRSSQRNFAARKLRWAIKQLENVRADIIRVEKELERLLGSMRPMPSAVPRKVW